MSGRVLSRGVRLASRGVRLASRGLELATRTAWQAIRTWSGDAAYETYRARVGTGAVLSREAFYLETLQRRYSRPNRCC